MKLAVIGGSLLKDIEGFSHRNTEQISTPFGSTSDNLTTGTINGVDVVYFNRHGSAHHIAPHQINYKANMFALQFLDVTDIIAVMAVGGITEKMSPMKWVLSDQIIDYTYSRNQTYSDTNNRAVNHIDFSYPFDETLSSRLAQSLTHINCEFEPRGTYGATQGPRLETIAEIKRMRRDGCDIVGMTAMPEASLARELEMRYANLSLVVNWAAGAEPVGSNETTQKHAIISMDEIAGRITEGNEVAGNIIQHLISQL
ncbi:MAG: S-methyl-5'-thioinosine phosphorylase [Gammaproteobacteria bacterium]|nr:S-methyl-5'-thioinosine phosphorylase [Gammaproteobacteria bacterium]